MTPRIISVFGPLKGETWILSHATFTIGRDPVNDLALDDLALSRQHCEIRIEGNTVSIHDLKSRNGTFVNDSQIINTVIKHGDYFKVGNSLFRFLTDAKPSVSEGSEVQLEDDDWLAASTANVHVVNRSDFTQDLRVLMQVSTAANSIRGITNIQRELLRLIFQAIPAERAALAMIEGSEPNLSSAYGLRRDSHQLEPIRISRTVVSQVFQRGVGLVANQLPDEGDIDAPSLMALRVRAFLCVPLVLHEKVQGVIYLDTSNPDVRFDANHQNLLTAIAGIAAVALENARHVARLESDNEQLRAEIHVESNIIGTSPPMQELNRFIGKVALTESTVLIRGESGTGKELVARAIHTNSSRAGKPFLAINCATLSETLLESELFGHEKGAFTGASTQKKGKLELAAGGTLFLDEVGELATTLQAKLLRVLQERKMERVGGVQSISLDIRIIAATNRDLDRAMEQGIFRRDLFYRLNVVSVVMPSLRNRKNDIPQLADSFSIKYASRCNRKIKGVSPEAISCLLQYDWPGNVRELENVIERAVVLGSTEWIMAEDLPDIILSSSSNTAISGQSSLGLYDLLREEKKRIIITALENSSDYGNAASTLGIHPNNLHRLIKGLNIRSTPKKSEIE